LDSNKTLIVKKTDPQTLQNIQTLSQMIQNLSPTINKKEADKLAKESIYYAMHLANTYDLVAPPTFQNYLVNQNQRERGLCYHWVQDILAHLNKEEYPSLGIYKVVANKGEYFTEHHAISITARGKPFHQGIVLDAWRNSGIMFFSLIQQDTQYTWHEQKRIQ
jgi:hypothetical protein